MATTSNKPRTTRRKLELSDRAMQWAMVPLGLLIFAPVIMVLLLGLLALVVICVRMTPNRMDSYSGWEPEARVQEKESDAAAVSSAPKPASATVTLLDEGDEHAAWDHAYRYASSSLRR